MRPTSLADLHADLLFIKLSFVQIFDDFLSFLRTFHGDEAKATTVFGKRISDDTNIDYLAVFRKFLNDFFIFDSFGKVGDVANVAWFEINLEYEIKFWKFLKILKIEYLIVDEFEIFGKVVKFWNFEKFVNFEIFDFLKLNICND